MWRTLWLFIFLVIPAWGSSQSRLLLAGSVASKASVSVHQDEFGRLILLQKKNTPYLNYRVTMEERQQAVAHRTAPFRSVIDQMVTRKIIKKLSGSTYVIAIESP